MKRFNYLLATAFLLAVVMITGCNNDEEVIGLTPTEAEAELETLSTGMSSDVQELTSSEAVANLNTMFALIATDPAIFGRTHEEKPKQGKIAKEKIDLLQRMFTPRETLKVNQTNFDFAANAGVYNWNATEEKFIKESTSSMVVLNFPSEGSSTNNATFRLMTYTKQAYTDDWGTYYQPTGITADLKVDNILLADFALAASYNDEGDPTTANIYLFVKPFTFTLEFDDTPVSSSTADVALFLHDETLLASGITINYTGSDKQMFKTAEGFVQYRNIKINGTVNADAENVEDLNDIIKLYISANGKKLGDIIFIYEEVTDEWGTYSEWVPYVRYRDGSKKPLEEVLAPVKAEMEQLLADLGNWYF